MYSGGADSVCAAAILADKYDIYGITFSYGQRAKREIVVAKKLARRLKMKKHKIVDIGFMKNLYGDNVLTDSKRNVPNKFEYSIVVPIRNAVFLSIATAWAYTLGAQLVGYGAHTGDIHYPDCRPVFAKKLADTFNLGEKDGIKLGLRKKIKIWSPYADSFSKSDLLRMGHEKLGDTLFVVENVNPIVKKRSWNESAYGLQILIFLRRPNFMPSFSPRLNVSASFLANTGLQSG